MKTEDKKKVVNALTEHSTWMRIGWLPIRLRPLTLAQIYEMGVYTNEMDAEGLEEGKKFNVAAEMLSRYQSAQLMQEVFLVCAYRKHWMRRLFRRYILNRLTIRGFQKVLEIITDGYAANFFLTSIIFLHQTKPMTEPSQTTHHGQQSEE